VNPGFLRHLASIVLLPFVVTVVVPWALLTSRRPRAPLWPSGSGAELIVRIAGVPILLVGLMLFIWCVLLFARVGQGTLAPWDPTRRLVAVGPYRYMRNPMITGVATILAGEALLTGSRSIAIWLALFVVVNHLYFLTVEEPGLARRFGADYEAYRLHVPRWIPRLKPWPEDHRSTRRS
jgi:protein-S-isoprenylcysteine O-methyltransferase Ste14